MEDKVPELTYKEDFKKIIETYELSDHAKKVLQDAKLVVLLGVAGGGRNTLINYLVKTAPFYFIVSDTTRPPKVRDGTLEEHGKHYFFRKEEDFLQDLKNGEFVEAEIIHDQQVSGTSIREVQKATTLGLVGIHDFDIVGAANIRRLKNDAYIIGLLPPNFDEWQKRLSGREEMHSKEFANRMRTAVLILEDMLAKPYFKFLISDDVHHSSAQLRNIVEHGVYTKEQHEQGILTIKSLLQNTKDLLHTL